MKRCELCERKAWVQCDADLAALCWDCDARVHSANFLVARHTRNLLCKICESVLKWSADGCRLTPIVSVCDQCATGRRNSATKEAEERGVVVEEEEEIHVVPSSPADSCSSSSSSKHEARDGDVEDLRKRWNDDVLEDSRKRYRTKNDEEEVISGSKRKTTSSKLLLLRDQIDKLI